MATRGWLLPFLVLAVSQCGETSHNMREARHRVVFAADVTLEGHTHTVSDIVKTGCAMTCLATPGCKSFGHQADTANCWLYDHLVQFTTDGIAAPGTQYSSLVSQRCPTELGYALEQGICYLYIPERMPLTNASAICQAMGGTFFIADTSEKVAFLKSKLTSSTWMGASDVEEEGVWRWWDGTILPLSSPLWKPGQPNDLGDDGQDALVADSEGLLQDARHLDGRNHAFCQVIMV